MNAMCARRGLSRVLRCDTASLRQSLHTTLCNPCFDRSRRQCATWWLQCCDELALECLVVPSGERRAHAAIAAHRIIVALIPILTRIDVVCRARARRHEGVEDVERPGRPGRCRRNRNSSHPANAKSPSRARLHRTAQRHRRYARCARRYPTAESVTRPVLSL